MNRENLYWYCYKHMYFGHRRKLKFVLVKQPKRRHRAINRLIHSHAAAVAKQIVEDKKRRSLDDFNS